MTASLARPDWPVDANWPKAAARADRLSPAERAAAQAQLAALYMVDGQGITAMEHQAVWRQVTWAGRLGLLEQAHAAAAEKLSRHFIHRLRHPDQHFGAVAELLVREMVRRSGARVRPAPKGKGRSLAEFLSDWPSGPRAIWEVKALLQGDAMKAADQVVIETQHLLMRLAREVPGCRGRLEWAPGLIDAPPDEAAVLVAVRFALARAKASVAAGLPCTVAIEGIATMHLVPDASCTELRLEYGGYAPSAEATFERMRRPADKAIRQMATHLHLPGILVLDVDACGFARNALHLLQEWAWMQPQLGVIIVIEREYGGQTAYGNVCLVPGFRFSEVADVISAFEYCERGHLHYQPICSPATPCESHFALPCRVD